MDAKRFLGFKVGDSVTWEGETSTIKRIRRAANNPRARCCNEELFLEDGRAIDYVAWRTATSEHEVPEFEASASDEAELAAILRCGYQRAGFEDKTVGSLLKWADDAAMIEMGEFPDGPVAWMEALAVCEPMDAAREGWALVASPVSERSWTFHKPDLSLPDAPDNPYWTVRFFGPARPW